MIHPTATVDGAARLDATVRVEANAYIGPGVEIGAGTRVGPHAVVLGPTRIGRDNTVHAHACLGDAPQDKGYAGEPTTLELGDRNVIREFVTMHRGTTEDTGRTRVGSDGFFMAYSHVAHDCRVGDGVVMANGVTLGGHVEVGDRANLGGLCAIHQFVRIGRNVMLGGGSIVRKDIPPFAMASGNRASLHGLNRRGLERAGLPAETITALRRAYRTLFRSGLRLEDALRALRESGSPTPEVVELIEFLEHSRRGVTR